MASNILPVMDLPGLKSRKFPETIFSSDCVIFQGHVDGVHASGFLHTLLSHFRNDEKIFGRKNRFATFEPRSVDQ